MSTLTPVRDDVRFLGPIERVENENLDDGLFRDWRTAFDERNAGKFEEFRGSYIVYYNGRCCAVAADLEDLDSVFSAKTGIPQERLVIMYIATPEDL